MNKLKLSEDEINKIYKKADEEQYFWVSYIAAVAMIILLIICIKAVQICN